MNSSIEKMCLKVKNFGVNKNSELKCEFLFKIIQLQEG